MTADRWLDPLDGRLLGALPGDATTDCDRASVLRDGWRLQSYLRYRPLVYYAAFGRPEMFGCLHLAVASLFEFGGYDGDVAVLTDAAHEGWAADLPEAWRTRVHVVPVPGADVLDWTLARYAICDRPEFAGYRPYLYLDADVVCNAPLGGLLAALAASPVLCAPGECAIMRPENWHGAALFTADGVSLPPNRPGFSTGIMGFATLGVVARLFSLTRTLALGYAGAEGTRDRFDCYDQPFANYAAVKDGAVLDLGLLNRFLDNRHFWHDRQPARRGLAHFTGGTDQATRKLPVMAGYVASLRTGR